MRKEIEEPPAAKPWQLTVRRWAPLARTCVTLSGVADASAIEALEDEIQLARQRGDDISLDLGRLEASHIFGEGALRSSTYG